MKKVLFLILMSFFLYLSSSSQKTAKLEDGTIVILYPDKTWKFETEIVNKSLNFQVDTSKIIASIDKYKDIRSAPELNSTKIDNFNHRKVEFIDYHDFYFTVKDSTDKIGYVDYFFLPNNDEIKQKIISRIVSNGQLAKKNLMIRNVKVEDINSASGVDFSLEWIFLNPKKIIKYAYFTVVPYNAVGDIQICSIRGHSSFTGKLTGPIKFDSTIQSTHWETAWYNNTIECIKLTKVEIIYMDGTSNVYLKDLPTIIDKNFKNRCN